MSVEWFKWAKSVKGLKSSEKFFLICLADFFNDNLGYAYPAQAYLLTSQTDDDWKAIGNGLPPPSEIMNI